MQPPWRRTASDPGHRRGLARTLLTLALVQANPGAAQEPGESAPAPVRIVAGGGAPGARTYVLLSGLMGGTAGFSRLEARLAPHSARVVTIDPYHLAIDSSAVAFADLARYVRALLLSHGIDSAIVVEHAHGAGVALRLAALDPGRVTALYLLDVGALPVARTKVFSAALRLAPFINHLPGGRRFLRGRILAGVRDNAARHEWLDRRTQHAYTEPLLDNLGRVVALAGRLANVPEPEPVASVVARVRAPVTLLLGAVPHPAGPDGEEIAALRPLGGRLRITHLADVGHFPHEEAPDAVAGILLAMARHP